MMANLLGLAGLMLVNAFLATARTVFANVSATGLEQSRDTGDTGARLAGLLLENPTRLQLTLRLLQTLTLLLFAFCLARLLLPQLQWASALLLTLLALGVTLALLVLGELLPQSLVVSAPTRWATRLAPAMLGLNWLCAPATRVLEWIAGRLGVPLSERERLLVTPDEIKDLVDAGEEGGSIEQDERQMIYSVFQFSDTLVREVMIPRIDVLALDVETPLTDAHAAVVENGFSRIPVYERSVDNVIGLLYAKDLLTAEAAGKDDPALREILRPPFFVPETKKIDALLPELQAQHMHMAIVVDEYGGMAGVVTLEDLVEELIGEVQDEYDLEQEVPFRQIGEHEYLVHGRMDIDDLNRKLQTEIDGGEADTLAGFIFGQLGRVPDIGERLEINGLLLEVQQVVERQIRWVRVSRRSELPAPASAAQDE
jgi:CBS domain containing-hemolysin-like protein